MSTNPEKSDEDNSSFVDLTEDNMDEVFLSQAFPTHLEEEEEVEVKGEGDGTPEVVEEVQQIQLTDELKDSLESIFSFRENLPHSELALLNEDFLVLQEKFFKKHSNGRAKPPVMIDLK